MCQRLSLNILDIEQLHKENLVEEVIVDDEWNSCSSSSTPTDSRRRKEDKVVSESSHVTNDLECGDSLPTQTQITFENPERKEEMEACVKAKEAKASRRKSIV